MESDPRFFLDIVAGKLWFAVLEFNKDIRDVRKEIGELRIGVLKVLKRSKIKSIEEKFLELNSRLIYMQDLEIGDFSGDSFWFSLYNKQYEELTEEEKKIIITDEKTNTREEFMIDVNKFIRYWSINPPRMKVDVIKAIRRAEKNLMLLDERIMSKFSHINELTAIKISVISMIIAVSSILISIFT